MLRRSTRRGGGNVANHKRKRPKSQRAGCFCKWWKDNAHKDREAARTVRDRRFEVSASEQGA